MLLNSIIPSQNWSPSLSLALFLQYFYFTLKLIDRYLWLIIFSFLDMSEPYFYILLNVSSQNDTTFTVFLFLLFLTFISSCQSSHSSNTLSNRWNRQHEKSRIRRSYKTKKFLIFRVNKIQESAPRIHFEQQPPNWCNNTPDWFIIISIILRIIILLPVLAIFLMFLLTFYYFVAAIITSDYGIVVALYTTINMVSSNTTFYDLYFKLVLWNLHFPLAKRFSDDDGGVYYYYHYCYLVSLGDSRNFYFLL